MAINRRRFLAAPTAAGALSATGIFTESAAAAPLSVLGVDAIRFGVRAGVSEDQSRALQRAIDMAAGARVPLVLGPGSYRAGDLRLPSGTQIVGVRGATRIIFSDGPSLISANQCEHIGLTGLVLDGGGRKLPDGRALVHLSNSRATRITDCEIVRPGGHGVVLQAVEGEMTGSTVTGAANTAIHSIDALGIIIARNTVREAGNNGIQVWRTKPGDDGTLILDNRIEDISASSGGSGQNGNGINVFRAANVVVKGNRIRGCAFSAVRGNTASNLQVVGNNCTSLGEVAIYAEFAFEGAIIANNVIDGAAIGVSVTNFKDGGRFAVVQGNVIRNLLPKRPAGTDPNDVAGVGIGVEGDTAVTGNVIENAPTAGILLGFGQYLRDVTATGNVVRQSRVGIGVSVVKGAGTAVIADNLISGVEQGAIVGMEGKRPVTGDLAKNGADQFAQLAISGNRVR